MTVEQMTVASMRAQALLLLNAFWHTTRLELRRAKYCAANVTLIQSLIEQATGEKADMPTLRGMAASEINATVTLDRPKMRVIFRRLYAIGDVDDFTRASGEVECETCGYKLYDHPSLDGRAKGLRMTCDGRKVKL